MRTRQSGGSLPCSGVETRPTSHRNCWILGGRASGRNGGDTLRCGQASCGGSGRAAESPARLHRAGLPGVHHGREEARRLSQEPSRANAVSRTHRQDSAGDPDPRRYTARGARRAEMPTARRRGVCHGFAAQIRHRRRSAANAAKELGFSRHSVNSHRCRRMRSAAHLGQPR
jgi:hypothetical protein